MNDWIKIDDELPIDGQKIKIRADYIWNGEATFKDGEFKPLWVKGGCFGKVTHWRPIDEN
jgi:hypothetical protein